MGRLYEELGIRGTVLDLMSSWISHFREKPERLVGLGLNEGELRSNPQLADWVVQDLNERPELPFEDATFDHAVCCVSVDYLVRPVEVFAEVGRVLRPGGLFVITFSDRLFPTKAIRGWLETDDEGHIGIVRRYFELSGRFGATEAELRTDPRAGGDPLYAVWARRRWCPRMKAACSDGAFGPRVHRRHRRCRVPRRRGAAPGRCSTRARGDSGPACQGVAGRV